MIEGERQASKSAALDGLRLALETGSSDSLKLLARPKDNPICSLSYDPSVPCLLVVWKKYATSTELRFIHETLLVMLDAYGVSRILGDDSVLPIIHPDDETWIVENWMPRARAAGLKAAASKRSSFYFGNVSIDHILASAEGLALRSFGDLDEARRWLRNPEAQ
jgi:hypothetical protein